MLAMSLPKVSVITTVKNEEENIAALLDSLLKLDYAGEMEIIVVDGGSTDNTAKIASKYVSVKLIVCTSNISEGRNVGIANATGEIIAFIDGDCIAQPDWITNLVKPFEEDSEIAVVGGPYIPLEPKGVVSTYLAIYQDSYFPKTSEITTYEHIAMGNAAVKKEFLTKIGGFDPHSDQFEDEDLCLRIWKLGKKLFFANNVRVFHKYRTTFTDTSHILVKRSKANFQFNKKHKKYRHLLFPYTRSLILMLLALLILSLLFVGLSLFAVELTLLFLGFYGYSYQHMTKLAHIPSLKLQTRLTLPFMDLYTKIIESFGFIF
jgi:glycosyltransferase involved in cell wall biosynthesis